MEEGRFRGRKADFVWMLIFGIAVMLTLAVCVNMFSKIRFLGHSLSFMMVYVWGRDIENADVRMLFLGLFPFHAPYLPWVYLLFSAIIGNPLETDLLGIVVGHLYFFLDVIYPEVARVRQWPERYRRIMVTPAFIQYFFERAREPNIRIEQ